MPVFALNSEIIFPPTNLAEPDGLLAVGGDLSPQRLLYAYQVGIFPWYSDDEPILWWSPNPRFIMTPDSIKVSKSMRQVLRSDKFRITLDTNFEGVINSCRQMPRKGQTGTWIGPEMKQAYIDLHKVGYAHSVEVWNKADELVGGLYGIAIGRVFFGESMFAKESNASKAGFISLARQLDLWGYTLIDCQIHTKHLESLGAFMLPREQYIKLLESHAIASENNKKWSFDSSFSFKTQ